MAGGGLDAPVRSGRVGKPGPVHIRRRVAVWPVARWRRATTANDDPSYGLSDQAFGPRRDTFMHDEPNDGDDVRRNAGTHWRR
jgi:hypothetical protein